VRGLRRLGLAAQNALDIMRAGRLSQKRYSAPFEVAHQESVFRLRHYAPDPAARPVEGTAAILLVPPLMVQAEVYDIDPEVSAVNGLREDGVDVWLVDFGAPEQEAGGMERTLDDHVRAVSKAVDLVCEATGSNIHLAGYSQGGMFCYQVAALRRSRGLASIIALGSPVDIHRNIPRVRDNFAERFIGVARAAIEPGLDRLDGVPGKLSSTVFKLLSVRKEAQQFVDFLSKLHDRQALEKRESRRLFLGGEGFVAWPGPALKKFIDEFIVNNRMASGGFVIDGRTLSLADIDCPILCFVGTRDDIARPPSVRAIREAAPRAEVHEIALKAGHFGLVVGSSARSRTWPTVVQWMRWRDGVGPRPRSLPPETDSSGPRGPAHDEDYDSAFDMFQVDLELAVDVAARAAGAAVERVGDWLSDANDSLDNLRYQVPRLARLRKIERGTFVSVGLALEERARELPDRTFFVWQDRAFTYQVANQRVDNIVRGFLQCGVKPGDRVAMVMGVRPSYLSAAVALSRLGAVAVLISPNTSDDGLARALRAGEAKFALSDPENAARLREAFIGDVLVLGGGPKRDLAAGVVDMEAIDPADVEVPSWYRPNPGTSDDLSLIIFASGRHGEPRAARITNRRWAFSAYGTAAACTLSPRDTVYCCFPLHHTAGALVSAGGALTGGARLALTKQFEPERFWTEVHRYGATVVFYAGEMCRALVDQPHSAADKKHPVRLFAGSGMRADVWRRVLDRFGPVGVLEFYASTEGTAVLANADGRKVGALGRPLPGSAELFAARYDYATRKLVRAPDGRAVPCEVGQPGMLLSAGDLDGVSAADADLTHRVVSNVREPDDLWVMSGDIVRVDSDGDFWFVDRASDTVLTSAGPVAAFEVENALYRVPGVELAVAFGVPVPGSDAQMTAAVVKQRATEADGSSGNAPVIDGPALLEAVATLPRRAWPRFVRVTDEIAMTGGFRPLKRPLREEGVRRTDRGFRYDAETHAYVPLDEAGYDATVAQLGGRSAASDSARARP